jgi:phosphatidylglycerophosphate synthase
MQTALYFSGVFGLFAFVLDFVDGHLARLDDNATYWGKYCDGLVDYIFPVMGLFAIGLGLSFQTENVWYVAVGGLISFIALLTRTSRDRLRYFQCWMIEKSGPFSEENVKYIQSWQRREYIVSVAAANGRTAAFFLLFLPDGGLMFFYSLLLIQGITEPSWLYICLRTGYVSLGRWRKSAHSIS